MQYGDAMPKAQLPSTDWPTVYLTNAQAQRLAAISLDSLAGVQIRTDASDLSAVWVDTVDVDDHQLLKHFLVFSDGTCVDQT